MSALDAARIRDRLSGLYSDFSKHSSYQTIPDFIAEAIGYQVKIIQDWRGDHVRLKYLEALIGPKNLTSWCDFGANTGFFSLTMAQAHADRRILAVEANRNHAEFIQIAKDAFGLTNLDVLCDSINSDGLATLAGHDVILHLNVLHHAGREFDEGLVKDPNGFAEYALEYMGKLRDGTRYVALQVGSNLWGDKSKPIVDYQDDSGKLNFFSEILVRAGWVVKDVAYAAISGGGSIEYEPLPSPFITRLNESAGHLPQRDIDKVLARFRLTMHKGEFYRRPLFFCSSS
jgi:hypothetical protein